MERAESPPRARRTSIDGGRMGSPRNSQDLSGTLASSPLRNLHADSEAGRLARASMSSLTGAVASRGSIDDLRQRMETIGTPATVAAGAGANAGEIETTRVDRLLREREQMRRTRSQTNLNASDEGDDFDGESVGRVQSLIIAANRLPISVKKKPDGTWDLRTSAGGLVSALLGVRKTYDMTWIGWPGVFVEEGPDRDALTATLRKQNFLPVYLTKTQVELYYNGYCNNVLWSLFHYVPLSFEAKLSEDTNMHAQWLAYKEANRAFSDAIMSVYRTGDVVWAHDYHLMLVPQMLRAYEDSMKIGWFLHTPFPSSEIYRMLPMREELLHGCLAADLGDEPNSWFRGDTRGRGK